MENPEEILHSLEEFAKLKPKDIPRELEEYLCFVAKTGDPVYQWSAVKSLFREKLINVITEFYESCPTVEIPPCPNVEMFNYDSMKNFILEKLDTFAAAPFTVQRICELLTTPRKEYNRIDKYMRALEKNILVVSTTEPGNRRSAENGEGIMNGLESEHIAEGNSNNDINVEEMDDTPAWPRVSQPESSSVPSVENNISAESKNTSTETVQETFVTESQSPQEPSTSAETVITCRSTEQSFVSIEPVVSETCTRNDDMDDSNVSVTITAIPAPVQKRRDSIEPIVTSDENILNESADKSEVENIETQLLKNSNKTETSDTVHNIEVVKSNRLTISDDSELKAAAEKERHLIEPPIQQTQTDKIESVNDAGDETGTSDDSVETNVTEKLDEVEPVSLLENNNAELPTDASEAKDSDEKINESIKDDIPDHKEVTGVALDQVGDDVLEPVKQDTKTESTSEEPEKKFEIFDQTVAAADDATTTTTEPQSSGLDVVEDVPNDSTETTDENKCEETPMEVDSDMDNNVETATPVPNELDNV